MIKASSKTTVMPVDHEISWKERRQEPLCKAAKSFMTKNNTWNTLGLCPYPERTQGETI